MTTLTNTAGTRSGDIAAFLDQLKSKQRPPAECGRLIFALDATASRELTWDRACRIQSEMFEATAGIGGLSTQLVYYRGFNECKASRWLSTAADMHRVMRSVTCVGGETQIQRVLEHAIHETQKQKLGAVIFVGDAMEEHVDRLCRLAAELGALKTPIFVFHEGHDPFARSALQRLAQLSHGAYLPFDLASIDRLKELLAAIAVYVTSGYAALKSYSETHGNTVLQLTDQMQR
jgi:hypothetical protein